MAARVDGRVIVGIEDSPAGLRTLRVAVTQAIQRRQELIAIHSFRLPRDRAAHRHARLAYGPAGSGEPLGPSRVWMTEVTERQRRAMRVIETAFEQAVGEVPGTVPVRLRASSGAPGPVLASAACYETDLLVVGVSAARRRWSFHRSVGRYCAAHAACPVLLVPAPELAREMGGRRRPWRRRELDRLLAVGPR